MMRRDQRKFENLIFQFIIFLRHLNSISRRQPSKVLFTTFLQTSKFYQSSPVFKRAIYRIINAIAIDDPKNPLNFFYRSTQYMFFSSFESLGSGEFNRPFKSIKYLPFCLLCPRINQRYFSFFTKSYRCTTDISVFVC